MGGKGEGKLEGDLEASESITETVLSECTKLLPSVSHMSLSKSLRTSGSTLATVSSRSYASSKVEKGAEGPEDWRPAR